MTDPRRAEVEAALIKAAAEHAMWTAPDFEALLAFMGLIGVDETTARAKLTELYTGRRGHLAIAPPGRHLRAGTWHALTGRSGGEPTMFVLVVVEGAACEAVRGSSSPSEWRMALGRRRTKDGEWDM